MVIVLEQMKVVLHIILKNSKKTLNLGIPGSGLLSYYARILEYTPDLEFEKYYSLLKMILITIFLKKKIHC